MVPGSIKEELSFGKIIAGHSKMKLRVNLAACTEEQLDKVLNVIKTLASSGKISKKISKSTDEGTLKAATVFLSKLAENEADWKLLSFYSALFYFINRTEHLYLNGTGTRGFSVSRRY